MNAAHPISPSRRPNVVRFAAGWRLSAAVSAAVLAALFAASAPARAGAPAAGVPSAAFAGAAAAPDTRAIEAEIQRLASAIDGVVGVAAWRLDGQGARIGVNADQAFPMASTYKVAIAGKILSDVDAGRLSLDRMIDVDPAMMVPSEVIADRFIHPGVSLSVYNLLELMLTQSDNTATDVLMAAAGGPAQVTAWVRGLGVDGLRVDRDTNALLRDFFGVHGEGTLEQAFEAAARQNPKLLERGAGAYPPFDTDPRDTATPEAMAQLLTRLFAGKALSPASTEVLTGIMQRCRTCGARLRGLLPAGTVVADKTGTVGGTVNSVGVIDLPDGRRVVTAVFVKESNAPVPDRERVIAEIARSVRDYYLFAAP